MVYIFSKLAVWPFLSLFIKRIKGLENLPDKPFIIAANHSSYIDGILLIFLVAWHKNARLCVYATNQKFLGPIWNRVFEHFGAIRVNGSLEKGLNALKKGNSMAIFPEGGRTYTGKLQPVTHTGLGVLALMSGVPVIPVGMNTYNFWNRFHYWPSFKRNIIVTIGKPMSFKGKPTKQNVKKTINAIWKEVKAVARISNAQTA